MFINQMFALSMVMDKEKFKKLFINKYGAVNYEESEKEYIDQSLASDGITVIYRNSQYKKKVRITVNSKLLLGVDKVDSGKLIRKLDKCISRYFDSEYRLDDFTLSGMALATDIGVSNRENVASYLKILHRIGRVKGFSPIYFDCFDDNTSFCLDGNSNGIQFLIYDLESLLRSQLGRTDIGRKKLKAIVAETQEILRAEVRLTKPKAIRGYTDEANVVGQIVELSENCQDIFMDTFTHIIPFGDYYKKEKAVEIIHRDVKDCIMRRKMLRLLALIPEKKSLHLAQKSMSCRDMEKIIDAFAKINLSPITISKRQNVKYMTNLYSFMLG